MRFLSLGEVLALHQRILFFAALILGGIVATALVGLLPDYEAPIWLTIGIAAAVIAWFDGYT